MQTGAPVYPAAMRRALILVGLVTALHLGGRLSGMVVLADLTQMLLMPAVAAVLWWGTADAPRGRRVRLVLLALFFSWLGDTVPRFVAADPSFLVMACCFLVAQVAYSLAFWPSRRSSLLTRPLSLVPYVLVAALIIVLCAPAAGALLPLIAVYAAAIVTMAVLATGLGRRAGAGAAIFVVSDALIALEAFGVLALPAQDVWVMSTYMAAQLLLVLAVCTAARPPGDAPGCSDAPRMIRGASRGTQEGQTGERSARERWSGVRGGG